MRWLNPWILYTRNNSYWDCGNYCHRLKCTGTFSVCFGISSQVGMKGSNCILNAHNNILLSEGMRIIAGMRRQIYIPSWGLENWKPSSEEDIRTFPQLFRIYSKNAITREWYEYLYCNLQLKHTHKTVFYVYSEVQYRLFTWFIAFFIYPLKIASCFFLVPSHK